MVTTVSKCPACGNLRESFSAVCPGCGYEFTDIQASDALIRFNERIDEFDRRIVMQDKFSGKSGTGCGTIFLWIVFFPVMLVVFIIKKLKAKHEELEGNEKLKSEAILNFPIPNSRNDLLEFIFLVENRIKPVTYFNALTQSGLKVQKWNYVWKNKAEHIRRKAGVALADDRRTMETIQESVDNINRRIARNDRTQWIMIGGLLAIFLAWLICCIII